MPIPFELNFDAQSGLTINLMLGGLALSRVPVRVEVLGANTFKVWGAVDSGEGPPAWAEEDLKLTFFGGDGEATSKEIITSIERVESQDGPGYRVTGTHARASVVLEMRMRKGELRTSMKIDNPQPPGGKHLPLCIAELRFEDLTLGPDTEFQNAHAYGGNTHGYGKISELQSPGVIFINGCIGQGLPLVYLHSPSRKHGLQFEFMMDGRPLAWLRRGSSSDRAHWCISWTTHRLLAPGQSHAYGGEAGIASYTGEPWQQICRWRDEAQARYGLVSQSAPAWAHDARIIEFNMNPDNKEKDFTRLDDPKCRTMLQSWRDMGYNAIFAVSCNHVGKNFLSPFDYEPRDEVGGLSGEMQCLEWAHELGFHIFLWVTTVGIDRDGKEVKEHTDWWTHRPNGELFYAWDSGPQTNYVGYAPDGDPTSTGWRGWLKDQVTSVIHRGYDGIFIDGCIPRADNHAKWYWPGEGRNLVEDQVCELADHVRSLGKELITYVEDETPATQATCEMTMGRYTTAAPFFKKAYWDHGMGGGPEANVSAPSRISAEMVRDYLLLRYASILPGNLSSDVVEGYFSEEARPWVVQTLLSGIAFKTHSQYVDEPAKWRAFSNAPEPSAAEKDPANRLKGHGEFLKLLAMVRDEPLVRRAPLSIAGVEIEGDAGVVGILRPIADRALLVLIQFANRSSQLSVRLTTPSDVPAMQRAVAGSPEHTSWRARELMHSMVDSAHAGDDQLAPGQALKTMIGPYGFRVFELTPSTR